MTAGPEYLADAVRSYDWSGVRHVIDVGDGTGALLAAVLRAHPQVRATLVDLPDTIERGREHLRASLGRALRVLWAELLRCAARRW